MDNEATEGPQTQVTELLVQDSELISVDIGVHDISRFEWRVALPLPSRGRLHYVIDAEFELPSTSVSSRSAWDQLQGFTRLEGPQLLSVGSDLSVDALRRRVVAFLQMLRRAREGFIRHCRLVADANGRAGGDEGAEQFLTAWLDAALSALALARAQLAAGADTDSAEVRHERMIADEFVSIRLLDFVAEAQSVVDSTVRLASSGAPRLAAVVALDERLARSVAEELRYRETKGYLIADASSSSTLERYVERAGRLKKHFEAILVLDRETYQLDDRTHAWFASLAALFAGAFAFGLQLVLTRAPTSSGSRLSLGLIALALLTGFVYAMRERFKEVSRAWLTGKVYRFYAQRVVRCRIPADRLSTRDVVVQAREWCNETTSARPDLLNPESGASLRVTLVNHVHRGIMSSQELLAEGGVRRIRQLFRYDLSPLFPRLHDPVKRVPVLDAETGRAHFVSAPRRYQIPVRVLVTAAGERHELRATVIVDKQGIVRLDPGAKLDPEELVPGR